jgi:cbb3-type cytochrome oxidase subunit 3
VVKQKRGYLFFVTGFITCFFSFSFCSGQKPILKTTIDKNKILIGEQFKLKAEATYSTTDYKLHWLNIPDSLLHFDIIDRSKIDSTFIDDKHLQVSQTFTLTSFDSGQWSIAPFIISFYPIVNDTAFNLFTDSLQITVSFSPPDSTNQLRDIKPIREVTTNRPLWQSIAIVTIIFLLIISLVWYFIYRKKNKAVTNYSSKLSPYDQAIKELNALIKYPLSNPLEIKIFHSKLGEIFKIYLSSKQNIDYLSKTTSDSLLLLNDKLPDKKIYSEVVSALRCGDAVKFAKYVPAEGENENCLVAIKNAVEVIEKSAL